jgi:general secretion pathway protein D
MKTKPLLLFALASGLAAGATANAADLPDGVQEKSNGRKASPRVVVVPSAAPGTTPIPNKGGEATLRLNFRAAPLDDVLAYLSDAAGFTIVFDTQVKGTVDVFNNNPLTRTEAVEVLNRALSRNGYAAVLNGRTLTVMTRAHAMEINTPIIVGTDPGDMDASEDIVTQVMPISFVGASQLIRDLNSLIPQTAQVTANDGGNAIIITDSKANIRHFAEIIKALDTSASSRAGIRVIPLRYADAKSVASVIKDLFSTDSSSQGRGGGTGPASGGFSGFGGGGPGGAPGGGGGPGGGGFQNGGGTPSRAGGGSSTLASRLKVVAVADERNNSLIFSAPDDLIPTVEQLVAAVDVNVDDITELRVFHLVNSDPTEMAEVLGSLFPDESKSGGNNSNSRFGPQFGGSQSGPPGFGGNGGGPGGGNGGFSSSAGAVSERSKKQGRVLAVPDPRTASLIISASHDLMHQIEAMIERLDSNSSRKQKVVVYNLKNSDAQAVQQVLNGLFGTQGNNRGSQQSGANQNSALGNRAAQSQTQGNTSGGNSGFGGNGGGGTGGAGFGRGQ